MRVALIAPIDLMEYQYSSSDIQLVLPQIKHPEYWEWVRRFQEQGDYIIMDNGAAEDAQLSNDELLRMALTHNVNELAIPDVLGDSKATCNKLNDFFLHGHFEMLTELLAKQGEGKFKFGFVAQGTTHHEAMSTVNYLMQGGWGDYLKTVYLPRLLLKSGDLYARIALANNIRTAYGDKLEIHMFGSAPQWTREALAISHEAKFVRSIDTSVPFNFAIATKHIWEYTRSAPTRVDDYFEYDCEHVNRDILDNNIGMYLSWAGGVDGAPL